MTSRSTCNYYSDTSTRELIVDYSISRPMWTITIHLGKDSSRRILTSSEWIVHGKSLNYSHKKYGSLVTCPEKHFDALPLLSEAFDDVRSVFGDKTNVERMEIDVDEVFVKFFHKGTYYEETFSLDKVTSPSLTAGAYLVYLLKTNIEGEACKSISE